MPVYVLLSTLVRTSARCLFAFQWRNATGGKGGGPPQV